MKINAKLLQQGTVSKISGTKFWKVDKEFIFEISFGNSKGRIKYVVNIEKGFKTDFGSIPRLFWVFFDKTEYVSYILHDYLYQFKGFKTCGYFVQISKRNADLCLFYSMINEGAGCLERGLVLLGLDIGGWLAWYNGQERCNYKKHDCT